MAEKPESQMVTCEGCGSKWKVNISKGRAAVIAQLVECPLCESIGEEEK